MNKIVGVFFSILFFSVFSSAQVTSNNRNLFFIKLFSPSELKVKPDPNSNRFSKKDFSLGIKFGSTGPGLEVTKGLPFNLFVRLNWSYLSFSRKVAMIKFSKDFNTHHTLTINLSSLLIDYYPFSGNSLHATIGLYYNQCHYIFNAKFAHADTIGAMVISPETFGEFSIDIFFPRFAPYLGVGIGRVVSRNRLSFYMDLGIIYFGEPKVDFTASGMISPIGDQDEIIADNVSEYRWFPVINFGIAYKFF